ncbi:phage tail tube protein [Bradyrhizobium sp. 31Argb]|uniref:phage tail tube protein n=1 Tax=Bradyrhizobium sp. 31Argb TaxID=3141247 RepID=UPI00374932BE
MATSIKFRKMVMLSKLETAYGTDPTLTGATNAILAKNITISPMEGQDLGRDLIIPYLGNQGTIPSGLYATMQFDTELAGSGTAGVAPAWGPLMRAAGFAEVLTPTTSVAYNPISDLIESAYMKFWMGSTLHALRGARGTGTVTQDAQGIPIIRWQFWGLYVDPTEATPAVPTLTAFKKPLVVSKANTPTFTVNAVPLVMRNFSLDFACQVEPRLLVNSESIELVDRAERINMTVEAVPVTTLDVYGLAKAQTTVAANIVHGTAAGNICTIVAPACQILRPTGYQNNQGVAEWPLVLAPQPVVGNDQFTLTLT